MSDSTIEYLYGLFEAHPHLSTDTRRIEPDSIFVALRGATFDGNRFAAEALAHGAVHAVVDDPEVAAAGGNRMTLVDDTLTALQALARLHRRRLQCPILGITGSNGKTTTKELVSRVLAERYPTLRATQGNLNNHIGVPLTLLSMPRGTEFGIVEMGASSCGEIALLCSIAEPDYGLITNVGRAHLEGFGGPEGVRRGKGELYDFLAAHGGTAFVRRDDATLASMAAERPALKTAYYDTALASGVEHQLEGDYNEANIAAAVAIGRHFAVPETAIRRAVAAYRPDNHRSQRMETAHNTLIVDCYNANPSSMQAALENFRTEASGTRTSKLVILGDMLELGEWSHTEHEEVIRRALTLPDTQIWLVGDEFKKAAAALPVSEQSERIHCFASRDEVAVLLDAERLENTLVLIKGSHGIGLEKIIDRF